MEVKADNDNDALENAKPQVAESGKREHWDFLLQINGTVNACHEEAGLVWCCVMLWWPVCAPCMLSRVPLTCVGDVHDAAAAAPVVPVLLAQQFSHFFSNTFFIRWFVY